MKNQNFKRWLIPSTAGVGIFLFVLTVFTWGIRVKAPSSGLKSSAEAPTLTLRSHEDADKARQEILLDLEPLFLPTTHNTSVLTLPLQGRRDPLSIAGTLQPKLAISESGGGVPFPDAIDVPSHPITVLTLGEPPNPWPEVGRADVAIPQLPPRLAFVEVATTKNGEAVLQETIPKSADPDLPAADWAPLEFLIAVDSAGLVGAPVITGSTSSDEVETFFRNFMVKKLRLGARLTPGFYTVRIGP